MKNLFSILTLLVISIPAFAQDNGVDMATTLRSSGKIYVVVVVIAVIFVGLLIYLFSIDKRLKKLEQRD